MAAQDNQKSVVKSIEFLRAEGNSRTLPSEATSYHIQESNEINLELSLGSWYSKNITTDEGPSDVAVTAGILETSNPSTSEVVRAAQSAARHPAFLRAIRYINSESKKRRLSRSRTTEGGGSSNISRGYSNIYQISLPIISQKPIQIYSISTVSRAEPYTRLTLGNRIPRSVRALGFLGRRQHGLERNVVLEVMTDGGVPSGNVIRGVLYKYTKEQVLIWCACHGRVFTPGDFVRHAGGGDVENPLNLIKMVGEKVLENPLNVTLN